MIYELTVGGGGERERSWFFHSSRLTLSNFNLTFFLFSSSPQPFIPFSLPLLLSLCHSRVLIADSVNLSFFVPCYTLFLPSPQFLAKAEEDSGSTEQTSDELN